MIYRLLIIIIFGLISLSSKTQTWEINEVSYEGRLYYLYPKFKNKCCWESVIFWKGEEGVSRRGLPRDGKWIQYFVEDSSKVAKVFEVKDGIFHGTWQEYHFNQQLENYGNYKEGKKDGIWKSWYENGKLESESLYEDGEFTGKSRSWFLNGDLSRVNNTDKDATRGYVTDYYETGGKEYEYIYFKWGQIDSEWYKNGQLKFRGKYRYGQLKNEVQTYYHENGQIAQQGKTKKGGKNGIWKYWHTNGQIKAEGRYRIYPITRKSTKFSISWQGLKVGYWKYWNEDGEILAEGIYKNIIDKKIDHYYEELSAMKIGKWKFADQKPENLNKIKKIDNVNHSDRFLNFD